jgi:two-component system, cell cycle sensor histidine kinase and response regulator CckA
MDQAPTLEALGRSAGVTAHDFNNLLTIILGYTSLLLRTMPENDPARASINEIQLAAERGRKLTQELLARYRAALPAGERRPP